MQIRKAVVTAAGKNQAQLPLQSVVNKFGEVRTALELLLDDIANSGIENVCVVICPGMEKSFRLAAGNHADRLVFVEQDNPRGYGDALLRSRPFVGDEPFLHLVSDHLYVSRNGQSCATQLIEVAKREQCAVSAIQATRESQLAYFGAIGGTPVPRQTGLYEVSRVLEKPTPTVAEQQLIVAGQRSGYYLCLFGMHVLTSEIFEVLADALQSLDSSASLNLSTSLDKFARGKRFLAAELDGVRYNIGEKYGLLTAQLAIALSGEDRDRVLTELLDIVSMTS